MVYARMADFLQILLTAKNESKEREDRLNSKNKHSVNANPLGVIPEQQASGYSIHRLVERRLGRNPRWGEMEHGHPSSHWAMGNAAMKTAKDAVEEGLRDSVPFPPGCWRGPRGERRHLPSLLPMDWSPPWSFQYPRYFQQQS